MMELFVFAILFTVTGAQQSQLEGPENTLSFVGSTVTLKCSSPSRNCNGIDWLKYVSGSSAMAVFKGPRTILGSVDRNRYSVDNSSGCNLVIKNVLLTDAGRFICSAIISSSQITKSANHIILMSQSKCITNASQDNTAEGDIVRMTCEVTYNDANRTSMEWKGVGLSNAPAAVKSGTTISRSYIVAASAPEVPSFTCATSFAFETADSGVPIAGLATNPLVTSCETPLFKLMYSVRNVTLSPSLSKIPSGSVINCTAKGHPSPTYKWQEMEGGSTWTDIQNQHGSEFTASSVSSKQYRCVAMNVVMGQRYTAASHEFLINNAGSDYNNTLTAITWDTNFLGLPLLAWVAGSSGATGLIILVIILVICCCVRSCPGYKCCHSENKSDDQIRDAPSPLGSPVYNTVSYTTLNVPPKAQTRPAAAAPTVSTKRPPAPPPMIMEPTDNRKAGRRANP